jgi:hypothetical protein
MEMEKGKLNVFFVDTELSWEPNKKFNHAFFTNATEDEFNSLLDDYVSEIESEGSDFNINFFRNYVLKSGYYAYVEIYKVLPPYAPLK